MPTIPFAAVLSLAIACGSDKPAPAAKRPPPSAAPTASAPPPKAVLRIDGPFPIVEGTRFTFRGHFGDDVLDTWKTTLTVIDRRSGRLQYVPHNDVASVFTKAGFQVDASGISIAGDTLEGPAAPVLAIPFPIAPGGGGEVPSLFPATYTVVARESVTVPAGTFDAWRVSIQDKVNQPAAVWIAPGTGVIKFQHSSGRVDELVAIEPPGA